MSEEQKGTSLPETVQFHYIKSLAYRVVYSEGAIGSVTPHGKIFVSLYNERAAIPRTVTHAVTADGALGEIVEIDTRTGIVRELEVGIILDKDAAVQLRDWLSQTITQLDAALNAAATKRGQ